MSKVEITGVISDGFSYVTGGAFLEADFILVDLPYKFQVITKAEIVEGFTDGDCVRIFGRLRENGGDVYIYATSIELKNQELLVFE